MQLEKIFCVIDPTTPNQRSLLRGMGIATGAGASLHMYVCMAPPTGLKARLKEPALVAEAQRYEAWMEKLAKPAVERGIKVTTEVECHEDWREALAPAAKRAGADLIIKGSFRRNSLRRQLLKTGDWALLRSAKSPVLFVKRDEVGRLDKILASVNVNAKDKKHQALTEEVIAYAKFVAESTGAKLHAVNAYSDSMQFVHPPDLAKKLGIERRQAHVGQGAPERVLAEVVEKLGNPLVIIGSVARRGVGGAIVGNTAERLLDHVDADVLCVVRR